MNKLKKILGLLAVLLIAVVVAWNMNVNSQTKGMSDLSMANVEALANGEGIIYGDQWCNIECYYPPGRCWSNVSFFGHNCQRVGEPEYECYCGN